MQEFLLQKPFFLHVKKRLLFSMMGTGKYFSSLYFIRSLLLFMVTDKSSQREKCIELPCEI